jgi:hypothetical protein
VRIQIILDQTNLDSFGPGRRQTLTKLGIFFLGALRLDFRPASSRQRLHSGQEGTRAVLFLGVMFFTNLPAWQSQRRHFLADEKAGALLKTHHRVERIIRLCLQPKNLFPVGDKGGVDLPQAPRLLERGFQFVFFRTFPTCVWEMRSQ